MAGNEQKGCLGLLLSIFGGGRGGSSARPAGGAADPPNVVMNKFFLSAAEQNFFGVLKHVVGVRGHVLAQVSLRQLLYFPGSKRDSPGRAAWQNKAAQKAIDFVVVNPKSLRPLVAIELDDATHATPRRQDRDEVVERLLETAGLPLVRVLASRSYDARELAASLGTYLDGQPPAGS